MLSTISVIRGAQPVSRLEASSRTSRKTWLQQFETDQGVNADMSWSGAQDRDMWRSL